jgi:hypothetical protein
MKRGKDKEMFAHVEKWKATGISIGAYAKSQGFSKGRMEYWAKKYNRQNLTRDEKVIFTELPKIKDIDKHSQEAGIHTPKIELSVPGGITIKIYI